MAVKENGDKKDDNKEDDISINKKKKTKRLVRANNKLYCQDSRNRFKPTKTIP